MKTISSFSILYQGSINEVIHNLLSYYEDKISRYENS